MTDARNAALLQELRALGVSYAAQLPDKIGQIEAAWEAAQEQGAAGELQALYRQVHNLSGSGSTFGFAEVSHAARELEQTLAMLARQATPASSEQCARVRAQMHGLRQAALAASRTSLP